MKRSHDKNGFTIVELLIVIVVIGILAAIVIVAFNGVQMRAANTKTTSAAVAWAKAIRLYHAEKGEFPSITRACLGTGYPTGFNGSGTTQCRTSAGDNENATLNAELQPYIGTVLPSPDMKAIGETGGSGWFRGILYYPDTPNQNMAVTMRGLSNANQCPQLSGMTQLASISTTHDGGISCRYRIEI